MSQKPSSSEEEYFARNEAQLKKKLAEERQAKMLEEDRERQKQLHYMRCPKCGMQLEEIEYGGVKLDKCFGCEGVWVDKGELEAVTQKEGGFLSRFSSLFR
ncbi:MAG: zf-TFIIB domain-containing protein [Bryobacteraceae bacterium]|nr:zf-TFIIB domain-containing protein [Bryobacteraceae bacterium]